MHAPVTVLGPGRRVGVWVQGCTLACPGCASRDTWAPAGGREIPVPELLATLTTLGADCTGLTVSGGEPLQQPGELAGLLRAVRADATARRQDWDVLLFTGLTPDEWTPAQRSAAELADAVVAGRYRAGEPGTASLRASANQELLLQTGLAERRYPVPSVPVSGPGPALQVSLEDGGLTMIGLPRPGDLARMERELRRRGVRLEEVSWRS